MSKSISIFVLSVVVIGSLAGVFFGFGVKAGAFFVLGLVNGAAYLIALATAGWNA